MKQNSKLGLFLGFQCQNRVVQFGAEVDDTMVTIWVFMAHGDGNDPVTPYEGALALQDIYNSLNIHSELVALEAWTWGLECSG